MAEEVTTATPYIPYVHSQILIVYFADVSSVKFSSDGRLLASASADQTIRTYAINPNGDPITEPTQVFTGHASGISDVAFSSNVRFIVSASDDKTLKLWDIETGIREDKLWDISSAKYIKKYTDHANSQYSVSSAFSITNGMRIVSGSEDNCVYMWDLNSKILLQKLEGHFEPVMSVACHPTENMIASGSLDRSIRIWTQEKE